MTEKAGRINVPSDPEFIAAIDAWRREQAKIPALAPAVRLLVLDALDRWRKDKERAEARRARRQQEPLQ